MTNEAGAAPAEQVKEKVPGVGDLAKELIRGGKTNEEVLAAIKEKFPEAKTSMASVNWYRNKLRSDGEDVPTARGLKAAAKAEQKAAKDKAKADAKAEKAKQREEAKAAKKAEKERLATERKAAKDAKKSEGASEGAGLGDALN